MWGGDGVVFEGFVLLSEEVSEGWDLTLFEEFGELVESFGWDLG